MRAIDADKLRSEFIKYMTVDSKHNDRRRKDYNQAIFGWRSDSVHKPDATYQCWCDMTMDMVLEKFDRAVKELSK